MHTLKNGYTILLPHELRKMLRKRGITIALWSDQMLVYVTVPKSEIINLTHSVAPDIHLQIRTDGRQIFMN